MSGYKHVFFDLDHTLWDFEKNCSETLDELYIKFRLSRFPFSAADLIEKYKLINYRMWHNYNRGNLSKEEIRKTRFALTFEALGLEKELVPEGINEEFLKLCPTKGNVMPYAHEVLDYLLGKYRLHIITNGFKDTQFIKISTSNLEKYFSGMVNSEICGFAKPRKEIFEFAMGKAGAACRECIMIGDDLYTDILGARNAGIDTVYFNPNEEKHEDPVTYEIKCLSELKKIL